MYWSGYCPCIARSCSFCSYCMRTQARFKGFCAGFGILGKLGWHSKMSYMLSSRHLEFLHVARNPSLLFSLETTARHCLAKWKYHWKVFTNINHLSWLTCGDQKIYLWWGKGSSIIDASITPITTQQDIIHYSFALPGKHFRPMGKGMYLYFPRKQWCRDVISPHLIQKCSTLY